MFKEMLFSNNIEWTGEKKGRLTSKNKPEITISTPPEFKGQEGLWSPEEMFLASINSCIMTTFLYFTEKFSAPFISYKSNIEGKVNFKSGKLIFTQITVKPRIEISAGDEKQKIQKIMKTSEKYCLISSSVAAEILVEPEISIKKD